MRGVGAPPAEGAFVIIAVPRQGVKSIDGAPLSTAKPDD
jgi:hypothetical protein